jgi:HPt (histidine-containing phosphotransfer) domain-containing protein
MAAMDDTRPVLDVTALDELRACDEDGASGLVAELIDIYLADTPARLVVLRQAFDAGDPAAIAREAHALKSSCGQLGATGMYQCCRQLEHLGREGSLAGVRELLARLDREFPQVTAALAVERGR